MRVFIARRLVSTVVVLVAVVALTFLVFHLLPTDVSQASCGKPCTPERRAEVRALLGYDQSILTQLLEFLRGVFVGRTFGEGAGAVRCDAPCLGYSFRLNEEVASLLGSRLPVTASIAVGAAALWVLVGVPAGILAALRRGTWVEQAILAATTIGVSAPTYLVGLAAIYLLGFKANVLPLGGYVPLTENPIQWAWHLAIPWIVLAVTSSAVYTRLTRSQLLETLSSRHVTTARAKGVPERSVVLRHGLRTGLLPLFTVFALDLGTLLGGTVITERLVSMPGLGALLIDAVHNLDLPVVLGVTLLAGAFVIVANLIVDLAYGRLDPRTRTVTTRIEESS